MSVKTRQTLLCCFCVVIIAVRYYATIPKSIQNPTHIQITARIEELPTKKNGQQYLKINDGTLIITRAYPQYHYGDLLKITGTLNAKRVIMHPDIEHLRDEPYWLLNLLYKQRQYFEDTLDRYLPRDNASLAEGMLLGTSREFSEETERAFKRTGTMHMIVVSGFNITLVATSILNLAGLVHRKVAITLAICGSILFVLLTGAQPPAIRAGAMTTILLIGQFFGRPASTVRALLMTILGIVCISPQLVTSLSFQLSCAATLGVLLVPPVISPVLTAAAKYFSRQGMKINKDIKIYVRKELVTTLSAQIGVLPLILNTFGTVSLISPLANLAVSWSVSYIMVSTLILCLAEYIYPPIAMLMSFVLYSFTAFFLQTVSLFALVPGASLDNIQINWYVVVGFYLVLIYLIIKNDDKEKCSIKEDL